MAVLGYRKEVFALEDKSFLWVARKKSLMNQSDLAEKVGVTVQTILSWEKEPEKVTLENLKKIYGALDSDGKSFLKKSLDSIFL